MRSAWICKVDRCKSEFVMGRDVRFFEPCGRWFRGINCTHLSQHSVISVREESHRFLYLLIAKKSPAALAAFEAAAMGEAVCPAENASIITDVRTMTIVPTLSI